MISLTTTRLNLPDTTEIAEALAQAIVRSLPTTWWERVGDQVAASIDVRALRQDIAAAVVARLPPEVYKGEY